MPNLEEQIYLLLHLGDVNLLNKKRKIRHSEIKILYQIHLYGKNVKKGKWNGIYPSRDTIASHAGVHRDTVRAFICSSSFKVFGEKIARSGRKNEYRLFDWVTDLFNAFERVGMMRGFNSNFDAWRRTFSKRINGAFLPLVQKGYSLNEVMNKLLTKTPLKSAGSKHLKSAATTYPSDRYTTHLKDGFKSNTERIKIPVVEDFGEVIDALSSRFTIKDGDINMLMKSFTLNHHKKACTLMSLWKQRGMEIKSPIRVYQTCLNRTKKYVP